MALPQWKQPSARARALRRIEIAAFHGDNSTATKVFIENRISFATYQEAFARGVRAREAGHKCECSECKEKAS